MPAYDEGYDYTKDDAPVPFDPERYMDDLEIADVDAIDKDPDQLLDERGGFTKVGVGVHDFVVLGLLVKKGASSPFTPINKDQFVDGKRCSLKTNACTVKLGLASNRNAQILLNLWLPPADPASLPAYYRGKKEAESKGDGGFMAGIFYRFMSSIGFPYPPGGKLPAEALRPKNWVGRTLRAEVIPGNDRYNQQTGEMEKGDNQLKPYYMWPCSNAAVASGTRAAPAVSKPSGNPEKAAPARQTVGAGRSKADLGLDNI